MEKTDSEDVIADGGHLQPAAAAELPQRVFAGRAPRRRWLAALPMDEKCKRFMQRQRMARAIKRAAERPDPRALAE